MTQDEFIEEILSDQRRLARELDVALFGQDGSAKQASMCDIVSAAKKMRAELSAFKEASEKILKENETCRVYAISLCRECFSRTGEMK